MNEWMMNEWMYKWKRHSLTIQSSKPPHGHMVRQWQSLLAILAINVKIAVFLLCGSKILFYSGVLHPSPFLYMSVNVAPWCQFRLWVHWATFFISHVITIPGFGYLPIPIFFRCRSCPSGLCFNITFIIIVDFIWRYKKPLSTGKYMYTYCIHACMSEQATWATYHKVIKAINPFHRKDHALKTNIPLCHIDCQYILNFKLLDGQTTSAIYSIKKKKIIYHINLNGTDLDTIQYMSNMKLGSLHPSPSKIQRAASSNQQRVNTLTLVASTSQKFSNVIFETKEMCNMCKHSHYQKTMCISNPYKLSTFWRLVSSFPPRG